MSRMPPPPPLSTPIQNSAAGCGARRCCSDPQDGKPARWVLLVPIKTNLAADRNRENPAGAGVCPRARCLLVPDRHHPRGFQGETPRQVGLWRGAWGGGAGALRGAAWRCPSPGSHQCGTFLFRFPWHGAWTSPGCAVAPECRVDGPGEPRGPPACTEHGQVGEMPLTGGGPLAPGASASLGAAALTPPSPGSLWASAGYLLPAAALTRDHPLAGGPPRVADGQASEIQGSQRPAPSGGSGKGPCCVPGLLGPQCVLAGGHSSSVCLLLNLPPSPSSKDTRVAFRAQLAKPR